ncbi:MAG: hypothetical protein ACOC8X_02725 [Chloroflexota bacterium]
MHSSATQILLLGILLVLSLATGCTGEDVVPAATVEASEYVSPQDDATATVAYPAPPTEEPERPATAYPAAPRATPSPTSQLRSTRPTAEATMASYLPIVGNGGGYPGPLATSTPAPQPPAPTPTEVVANEPVPTLDFAALEEELAQQNQALAYSKIGFHVTFMEEKGMLDEWMQRQDAAGVPFYLKTVDNAEPLYKAQQLREASGVPHTLVFRATGGVPDYDLPPEQAALEHWTFHRDKFPPELDPSVVWVETVNEVDKNRSEWLAEFALETARLAMADGFKWAAFGWAPGEPEPEHWELPAMLEFLRLAGENPDRLAIAVHEGSLAAEDIKALYPYRLGRFLQLFEITDRHGIPRPTVLITEWGWEYDNIPDIDKAMQDIRWAASLYAPFPQVKGAAIWNLGTGCCFGDVSEEVRGLIDPLLAFNLSAYFTAPQTPDKASTDPALYE